ncbi:hypothetical protein FNV43_RR03491 [Rhamnella rubrinervis]|uniref:Prolamin-like domain-containing protein n=1 Tax=Rhamnella rubrinervis TaxID=2594499 RepID=A0A8K0HK33_9ROSA|nr:hypothetical protein FNV43_RR03491 [Rhamnella rubrinervis]
MAATKSGKTLVMMIMVVWLVMNIMVSEGEADQNVGLLKKEVIFDEEALDVFGADKGWSSDKLKWKCISVVSDVFSCVKLYFKEGSVSLIKEMDRKCCKAAATVHKCLPFLLILLPNYDPELVKVSCALIGVPF